MIKNIDIMVIIKVIDLKQAVMMKGNEFLSQPLIFSPYIFATRCRGTLIFQTMNSVISKSLSMKYQMCTPSG